MKRSLNVGTNNSPVQQYCLTTQYSKKAKRYHPDSSNNQTASTPPISYFSAPPQDKESNSHNSSQPSALDALSSILSDLNAHEGSSLDSLVSFCTNKDKLEALANEVTSLAEDTQRNTLISLCNALFNNSNPSCKEKILKCIICLSENITIVKAITSVDAKLLLTLFNELANSLSSLLSAKLYTPNTNSTK